MKLNRQFLFAALLGAGLALTGSAQTKKNAAPEKKISTGPEVGQKIPAFEAVDQNGKRQTFETLKGPNGLFLLFHRSADW